MRNGMKQTEIGEIPEEWEETSLGEVFNFLNGRAFKPSEWSSTGLPIIRIQNLNGSTEFNYYEGDVHDQYIVFPQQLLFSWSGSRGTSFGPFVWYGKTGVLNQHIFKVNVKNNSILNIDFGYYYLRYITSDIEERAHGGGGLVHITKKELEKFKFPLPPFAEQQKIAEILTTVDKKMAVIDEQLAKTAELKTGLMQRLLTKGIGHTTFKDSPLGEIPESWEVVQIKDIGEVKGGKRLPKGEELVSYDTGFPYIKAGDLKKGTVITAKLEYLTPEIQKKIKNYTISSDDTYITIVGAYIGDVGVIPKFLSGSNLTENAAKIHRLRRVNNRYLAYFLASELGKVQIKSAIGTGAQPKLALMRIQDFWFAKPSESEQLKILNILTTIDEKIQVLRDKKEHYQTLKRGLMQQLLTGKLRVRVTEDAVPV